MIDIWDGKHEVIEIPAELSTLVTEQCITSAFVEVPFIHGEFYVVLEVVSDRTADGAIEIEMNIDSCLVTQCHPR